MRSWRSHLYDNKHAHLSTDVIFGVYCSCYHFECCEEEEGGGGGGGNISLIQVVMYALGTSTFGWCLTPSL